MQQALAPLIREATAADAEAIARVRVASWRAAYRGVIDDAWLDRMSVGLLRDRLLRGFDPGPTAAFTRVLADGEGRLVGFASAGPERGPGAVTRRGELWTLYLLPEVQRRGLGARLMRSMARGLDRRGLDAMVVWALARNAPARAFYERLGGRPAGERPTAVGAQRLEEVAYAWDDLRGLVRSD